LLVFEVSEKPAFGSAFLFPVVRFVRLGQTRA
jgi:hypothetical protein